MITIEEAWQLFGLKRGADLKTIKQAYRQLAKQWHPDQFVGDESAIKQAEAKIKEINEAYELIKQQLSESSSGKVQLRTEKTNPDFYYQRGVINAELEDYQEAIEDFSHAIKLDESYLKAYQYRAFLYEKLGYTYRAEADFLKVRQIKLQQTTASASCAAQPPTTEESVKEPETPSSGSSPAESPEEEEPISEPETPPSESAPAEPPEEEEPISEPETTPNQDSIRSSNWRCIHILSGHKDAVSTCAVSAQGLVISGSYDCTVKLWNLKTGDLLKTIEAHSDRVNAVALSADGQSFASACENGSIKVWKLGKGKVKESLRLNAHNAAVTCLQFSLNGQLLITGSEDKTVKLWNLETGELVKTLIGYSAHLMDLALSADGDYFASSALEPLVRIRQIADGKLVRSLKSPSAISSLAFSPDGLSLAAAGYNHQIDFWQVPDYTKLWSANHGSPISSLAFSPHHSLIASGSEDRAIKLWHTQTGELLETIKEHNGAVTSLQFLAHPKLHVLLSGSEDGTLKVWKSDL
ncbi:DnaJ domain-containing protein [Roseofilum sp. BLCC_M154]|uniref:DnaJ domain-containing protein n=1 Tax=Roseofilum acuticapitatum BLCC-M154 TaxID=3022444 RepID=A0ABT7AM49_9CYAN|nr:DnaJ domain-containing protein [Roseofilum acuticapitatum]MDJ1167970.1 DnaJ domain-containing protein [Roseofilum acuticapitatum BLCC-M154]